jgi:hypothetical protein
LGDNVPVKKLNEELKMANWKRTLDLVSIFRSAESEIITASQASALVANQISKLNPIGLDFIDDTLVDIEEEFITLSKDENFTFDDFDEVMGSLYDWADIPIDTKTKNCWVKTF